MTGCWMWLDNLLLKKQSSNIQHLTVLTYELRGKEFPPPESPASRGTIIASNGKLSPAGGRFRGWNDLEDFNFYTYWVFR